MKGFRDTSKMMTGHNFARGGHSMQAHFPVQRAAHGLPAGGDSVNGLTKHGLANSPGQDGHSQVQRRVPSTMELETGGGKTPLNAGYASGGKAAKHFHVHKHVYGKGGKVKTVSKSYMKKMEMQAEQGGDTNANGGFTSGSTGGSRPKLAKGGKMHINPAHKGKFTKKMTGSKHGHLTGSDVQRGLHSKSGETRKEANFARMARRRFEPLGKASGGHIHDDTHEIAPDYATGGTINRFGAGGALYAKGGESASHERAEMGALHRIEKSLKHRG